jgi:hypothetical protein
VNFEGKKFHENCFKCCECNRVLDLDNFYKVKGLPYCKADYFAQKK